jgi:hypothetical protein
MSVYLGAARAQKKYLQTQRPEILNVLPGQPGKVGRSSDQDRAIKTATAGCHGNKIYITNGPIADVTVLAVSDPGQARGVTWPSSSRGWKASLSLDRADGHIRQRGG